jgi:hypothetical protein
MKIPIRFGLLITFGVMAWVLIAHSLVTNPRSLVHTFAGPVFFNILQFIMIFLGLKGLEREKADKLTFKEGLKTGAAISFVYALAISLFFIGVLAVVGTKWLASEPGMANMPVARVAAQAFIGLFVGSMILGLIYSTVISFFLSKRFSEEGRG